MLSDEFNEAVTRRAKWMQEKSMSRESGLDYEFCMRVYNKYHKNKISFEGCGACQRRHMGQVIGGWIEKSIAKNEMIYD